MVVYIAEVGPNPIILGVHTTEEGARRRCEQYVRRELTWEDRDGGLYGAEWERMWFRVTSHVVK